MFSSSIVLPLASRMDTVPIFLMHMTWLAIVTKSMLLALVILKKMWLLYKYCYAYEFKNQVLKLKSCWNYYFLTMNAVATGLRVNGCGPELLWSLVT